MAIQINWCPVEKTAELQTFIQHHWAKNHLLARDAQFLRWQYPYAEQPDLIRFAIAESADEIVGVFGSIECYYSIRNQKVAGTWGSVWYVRPERRLSNAGIRLLRFVMGDHDAPYAAQGLSEITVRLFKKLGFFVIEEMPRWWRVLSPNALARMYEFAGSEPPALPISSNRGTAPSNVEIVEWSSVKDRWDAAWETRFAPAIIGTWRDSEYLTWRYVEHPSFTYHLLFTEEAGDITGVLCYRLADIAGCAEKVMRIVEYLTITPEAGRALAWEAIRRGTEADAAFADFYCTGIRYAQQLEEFGFSREPSGLPCLFQPLDLNERPLNAAFHSKEVNFDSPDLYVTRSDGDQDRPN